MDKDLIQSIVRRAITFGAGYLAAKGFANGATLSDSAANEIAAMVAVLLTTLWSKYHQLKLKNNEKIS